MYTGNLLKKLIHSWVTFVGGDGVACGPARQPILSMVLRHFFNLKRVLLLASCPVQDAAIWDIFLLASSQLRGTSCPYRPI